MDRMIATGLADHVADVVLAAFAGPTELATTLTAVTPGGERSDGAPRGDRGQGHPPGPAADAEPEPGPSSATGIFVKAITVEGFRGIGPEAALRLAPGPGLTVVTGRNGSGKSSFAEAAELALTATNRRWAKRSQVWRDGWRNLHHSGPARIRVDLVADEESGVTRVAWQWRKGAGLADADAFVQSSGRTRSGVTSLGWDRALELFRPFLSYAELGALVEGRPSDMYDALARVLGLDRLAAAERLLTDQRREWDAAAKESAAALPPVLALLESHPDDRAGRLRTMLAARSPDLDAVEVLAGGRGGAPAADVGGLAGLAMVAVPDPDDVQALVTALVDAGRVREDVSTGSAADARRVAGLLDAALVYHVEHPGEPCPVCAGAVLDQAWASAAQTEARRLRQVAAEADAAHRAHDAALAGVRHVVGAAPPLLQTLPADADDRLTSAAAEVLRAWQAWRALVDADDGSSLPERWAVTYQALADSAAGLRAEAAAQQRRRAQEWQPVAEAVTGWVEVARRSARARDAAARVKGAVAWLKSAGEEIRDARLAPFASASAQVWADLRQESNVDLGPIHLSGTSTSTHRKVALDVTIEGVQGAALGVMSQGELHALGLALFLPRATAPASPFRFVIIDDPVQAMDPAKVDGLARVLSRAARSRQVVVFTHDDRLAEAVRRLDLPATIWEVVRRDGSVVEVTKNDDPVTRYLSDAHAMAKTDELTVDARALVVVAFCRAALEAACHERVRRRRIGAGARFADVEAAIAAARTLHQTTALALFDDADRGGEVVARMRSAGGGSAARAFTAVKTGVHEPYGGDLVTLVREVGELAARVRA